MHVWRIATDTPDYGSDDLSGKGAQSSGGRWNEKGTPAVYAAGSIALACLETLVHLGAGALPLNRYLVRIEIPDNVWAARTVLATPPVGWDAIPPGLVSIQAGQQWLTAVSAAVLEVPSVVVPEERNVVINPAHADVGNIHAFKVRKWLYDARMT
jgi:RES domain-containing protein